MKFLVAFTLGLAALADLAAAEGNFKNTCKTDWYVEDGHYMVATCKRKDGSYMRTRQDMNLCIGYYKSSGVLLGQDK